MGTSFNKMAREFANSLKNIPDSKTSPYDTQAEVRRIEGNTAWVHIPGGVDETPVQLTSNAKKGDIVQVRVSGGNAWLYGNVTAPPTDDTKADEAKETAMIADENATNSLSSAILAQQFASEAKGYALEAKETTDEINEYAATVSKTVTQVLTDGETAGVAAQEAKDSAKNASDYAARALGNLSTVQNITETLNWITAHGDMALTTDVALDPTHVYFVVDAGGDYVVRGVTYAIVTEPDVDDIGAYYELTIDESLNNYVATHLALTNAGLNLWQISGHGDDYRLHQGVVYENPQLSLPFGVYILTSNDKPIAQFTGSKMQLGLDDSGHITITSDQSGNKIEFFENAETSVASITNSEMYIARTVVIQSMKVGNWQWTAMPSGNLRLQWIGG